jgi:predicted DNA-binding transcriptional regulator AlpA
MMPTLVPKVRGKPIEDRRVIVMALMQAAASDQSIEQLLTADEVAERLRVSRDWVWDHSSRRLPYLPVIRMSDGALRYRSSEIEEFLEERARAAQLRRRR